jgi:hypothetical protein
VAAQGTDRMITRNTYAGEWPDTDDQARVIVDSVLGNVPCACLSHVPSGKDAGRRPGAAVFQR